MPRVCRVPGRQPEDCGAARARDYVRFETVQQGEHQQEASIKEPASKPKAPASEAKQQPAAPISKAKPQASEPMKDSTTDLSERQLAGLNALRSLMHKENLVELRAAEVATA